MTLRKTENVTKGSGHAVQSPKFQKHFDIRYNREMQYLHYYLLLIT